MVERVVFRVEKKVKMYEQLNFCYLHRQRWWEKIVTLKELFEKTLKFDILLIVKNGD